MATPRTGCEGWMKPGSSMMSTRGYFTFPCSVQSHVTNTASPTPPMHRCVSHRDAVQQLSCFIPAQLLHPRTAASSPHSCFIPAQLLHPRTAASSPHSCFIPAQLLHPCTAVTLTEDQLSLLD
ncbi:hypothetical protein D9C73_004620 [Collichthys lucidus]|uniref:Uncharacterized protein n=1 Tax=Collichthys lucidus TaxID=240159 RepID=A0A4U5UD30_COLLU|nr:hypothetical protein D9C73_004620 [Collichthys lucidus]